MTDSTADILRKARDHIAEPGMWWQGHFSPRSYDPIGGALSGDPCCATGAVHWATGKRGTPGGSEALSVLFTALPNEWRERVYAVADFNDAPGRTQSEVVALFDRAIELAEKEGGT